MVEIIDPSVFIRRYAEANKDWPYSSFVTKWYPRAETIKARFFDGVFKPWDLSRLPSPPIAVEDMRNYRYLASYHLIPDCYGFNDKLTINEVHLVRDENRNYNWDYGGDWGLSETITHEICHEACVRRGLSRSHDKPFTDKLEELGIHCDNRGVHKAIADADKPFGILMQEWFIRRPDDLPQAEGKLSINWWLIDFGGVKRGRSSLTKWECEGCGLKVRVGIKGNP